jgi:DNA-binding transcriptional regulator YhcF (GntR family)
MDYIDSPSLLIPEPNPGTTIVPVVACAYGNRCGHDPLHPRIFDITPPPGRNPNRPTVILKAIENVTEFYVNPRDSKWDVISQADRRHTLGIKAANIGGANTPEGEAILALDKWHQQRTERREALTSVIEVILYYTDVATNQVGIPDDEKGTLGLSARWIAKQAGLSFSRAKRALATLRRANMIVTTSEGKRFVPGKGWVYRGFGAIRKVSRHLIRLLGVEVAWDLEKRRRQGEKEAIKKAEEDAQADQNKATMGGLAASIRQKARLPKSHFLDRQRTMEQKRTEAELICELSERGKSLEEIKQLLVEAKIRPPD